MCVFMVLDYHLFTIQSYKIISIYANIYTNILKKKLKSFLGKKFENARSLYNFQWPFCEKSCNFAPEIKKETINDDEKEKLHGTDGAYC